MIEKFNTKLNFKTISWIGDCALEKKAQRIHHFEDDKWFDILEKIFILCATKTAKR